MPSFRALAAHASHKSRHCSTARTQPRHWPPAQLHTHRQLWVRTQRLQAPHLSACHHHHAMPQRIPHRRHILSGSITCCAEAYQQGDMTSTLPWCVGPPAPTKHTSCQAQQPWRTATRSQACCKTELPFLKHTGVSSEPADDQHPGVSSEPADDLSSETRGPACTPPGP